VFGRSASDHCVQKGIVSLVLAELELPKLVIPERVRRNARQPRIELSSDGAPDGALWISCCYAMPHVDRSRDWEHLVFLTVSVLSTHMVGDALAPEPQVPVPSGRMFVVDPLTAHWLVDKDSWTRKAARPWVGLQWEIERGDAARKARELVSLYQGSWLPTEDSRYSDWRRSMPK